MSKIGNYILEAIDVMAQAKVDGLRFDKTVVGIIYSIVNEDTGEYKVQYQDSIFTAWSTNEKYKVGVSVYVKIPEGDFSNKKMIEGLSKNLDIDEKNIENLTNYRVDVGDKKEIAKNKKLDLENKGIELGQLTLDEKYDIIKLEGEFTTDFNKNKEYNFDFGIYTDQKEDLLINLNFSSSPYYMTDNRQFVYLPADLIRNKTLYFIADPLNDNNPLVGDETITLKSLTYSYVDSIDFTKINQYLYINKINETTLKANLIVRAKSVIEDPNCAIYWYKRNQAAEGKTLAGYGWEELTDYRGKNEISLEGLEGLIKVITIYDGIQMEAQYQISSDVDKLIIETTYSGDNAILTAKKNGEECDCDWYYTEEPENKLAANSKIYEIINYKKLKNDLHFLVKEANSNGTNN